MSNCKARTGCTYDVILAELNEAVAKVREFGGTVTGTKLPHWAETQKEVGTAFAKLVDKMQQAQAHLEACLICKPCYIHHILI